MSEKPLQWCGEKCTRCYEISMIRCDDMRGVISVAARVVLRCSLVTTDARDLRRTERYVMRPSCPEARGWVNFWGSIIKRIKRPALLFIGPKGILQGSN